MCNIDEAESIKIFVTAIPDKETEKPSRWLPYLPMMISSTVTFFMIFSVLVTLGKESNPTEVFNLAGIPTIVVFLSQLGYATQDSWVRALRKLPSR